MEVHSQISFHRALAFGDSVMWGQGLRHANKFSTRIARRVFGIHLSRNAVVAHSGAVLDTGVGVNRRDVEPAEDAPIYGEIPRDDPSIFRQVLTYGLPLPLNEIANRDIPPVVFPEVSVVFLNGGINDIGASELVSGNLGGFNDIEELVDQICRRRFLELLRLVRQRFPSSKILTFGYHFVFSQYSLSKLLDIADWVLDEGDEVADQIRRAIRQSSWFMGLSTAAHQQAVDTFNQSDMAEGRPGAIYVPSLQGPEHATFTDQSLSWGIENRNLPEHARRFLEGILRKDWIELANFRSDDEVKRLREVYCEAYALDVRGGLGNDVAADASCQLAALFHPNSAGAARISALAEHVHSDFESPPSFRTAFGDRESSLLRFAARRGFQPPFSYRQLFTTALIGSIRLDGIVEPGSDGDFPYHLLYLELTVDQESTPRRYPLNDILPFVAGFGDQNDYIFPGASGPVFQHEGFITVRDVEHDTPFTFFAYPTDPVSINSVTQIRIGAEETEGNFSLLLRDLRLEVNGRTLALLIDHPVVRTGQTHFLF